MGETSRRILQIQLIFFRCTGRLNFEMYIYYKYVYGVFSLFSAAVNTRAKGITAGYIASKSKCRQNMLLH